MMRKSCRTALDTRLIELGTCRMTLGSRRIAVETRRMELKICPITQGSSRRALGSCRVAFVTCRMKKGICRSAKNNVAGNGVPLSISRCARNNSVVNSQRAIKSDFEKR